MLIQMGLKIFVHKINWGILAKFQDSDIKVGSKTDTDITVESTIVADAAIKIKCMFDTPNFKAIKKICT